MTTTRGSFEARIHAWLSDPEAESYEFVGGRGIGQLLRLAREEDEIVTELLASLKLMIEGVEAAQVVFEGMRRVGMLERAENYGQANADSALERARAIIAKVEAE